VLVIVYTFLVGLLVRSAVILTNSCDFDNLLQLV